MKDALNLGDNIQKLGVREIIEELESNLLDDDKKVNPDIYMAKKMDTEKLILDLSLKYQALSKQTAFICKIQENVGRTEKAKIIIPSLISGDY